METAANKIDLTDNNQKIFAGILLVVILCVLYWLLPPLVELFKNLWLLAILAIPVIFIVMNPMLVWNIFKQISWSLTKTLISGDKLGYMYRYHDYLLNKIDKLSLSINSIGGVRIKLTRKLAQLKEKIDKDIRQVDYYQKSNASQLVINTLTNQINIDTKQYESLLPRIVSIEKQEKYLKELHDAWVADSKDLKYTLDAKAEEYKLLKEVSEAAGNAQEFLKGNSEEYKIYKESLDQIEESVSLYTSNVENFERQVKPLLETISSGRVISENEGLKIVEEYKKNKISLKP